MRGRSFPQHYDRLIRALRRRKRMLLGEISLILGVCPDRARAIVKAIAEADDHVKLEGRTLRWVETPIEEYLPKEEDDGERENG